jgi:hypothetical protein
MDRTIQLKNIQKKAFDLFSKKNADYGDSFKLFGVIGVLVRLQDKINRAISISSKSIILVEDESLKDTLLDLHNYAAMALMLLDEPHFVSMETKEDGTLSILRSNGEKEEEPNYLY